MAGKFELPKESVEVKYLKKQTGNVTNEKHILYGGMMEGAYITFRPKKQKNGTYANILTNEEKDYLEEALGFGKGSNELSVYKKEGNYWDSVKLKIGKEGLYLELSDPEQYIQYKLLLSLTDLVCPNVEVLEKNPRQTYKYVIVRKDDVAKQVLKKVDITKEAYKLLGKIEDNLDAMRDFLMVSGIHLPENSGHLILTAEVSKLLNENPEKFVQTLKDPSYATRVLLHKAMSIGEIVKKGTHYYSREGEPLAEPNQHPTLENTIKYLESSMYQEYKLILMSKIEK